MIEIRINEGADPQPYLAWDTVWDQKAQEGDWALAGPGESLNRGGLRAIAGLETAVELALFTDRRCPADHPLARYADGDLRGWWGNSIDQRADLGEVELGSLLWLLERAALTDDIVRWAKSLAEDALAPLIAQGAAAKMTVIAERVEGSRLNLGISLFARDGASVYARKFEILWQQVGL